MTLAAGTRLGPYEILNTVGAGGMGEVYRARDTRLDRVVAIKILPGSFASDRERLERFQREARILSSLNHPNLMTIYDVGSQDDTHFLVSEFLEGHSLRERLSNGPLPQRKVIEYGLQIAKGLAAAHEKGIVHRDLKPDNIFVLRDERVKILDFGLAKQAVRAAAADQTMTRPDQTSAGTVLGTAGYMSPEQVRGETLDHRSDIFSFGAILYEMAAGQRAFKGDSSVEVMTAILKQEPPDLAESGLNVSVGLQRIVHRCLEKKPEARFQSASDLAFALDALSSPGTSTGSLRPLKDQGKNRSRLLLAGVGVLALVIAALAATWFLHRPATGHPDFLKMTYRTAYVRHARFSPDGHTVVFDSTTDGKPTELVSTRTDTMVAQPLNVTGSILDISSKGDLAMATAVTFDPKFSPQGRLAVAPLGGGSARELLDNVLDADWTPDGSALAIARRVNEHVQLEWPAGKVVYQTDGYISDVRFSPSGDAIAFIDHQIYGDDRGYVDVIDSQGKRRVLSREFASIQGLAWVLSGKEIWITAAAGAGGRLLRAISLDGHERVLLSAPADMHLQDIAENGNVLMTVEDFRDQQLLVDTASGKITDIGTFPFQITDGLARDGSIVLLNGYDVGENSDYNLYVQKTDGSTPTMIGLGTGLGLSFDRKWALALSPLDLRQLRVIPTGMGEPRTLTAPAGQTYWSAAWMPDGKSVVILTVDGRHQHSSYVQEIETGATRPITSEGRWLAGVDDRGVGVSPDGKFCIVTDGQGRYWIQPLDGGEATEIKGLLENEQPIQWHNDSQNIFVERRVSDNEIEIYDFNPASGQRKLWTKFSPPDKTAVIAVRHPIITPDGSRAVYVVQRIFSTLYLGKNLH
jgi:eukaryotic-like serine/threonine-protein kinase